MKLVEDWRKAWKWLSVQGLAVLASAPIIYDNLPTLQEYLSPSLFHKLMGVAAVLVLLGRLVKQG